MNACHVCAKLSGGNAFCSERCVKRSRMKIGDEIVLDSGYTSDLNGIPFKITGRSKRDFTGFVRGKKVSFYQEMAAKVDTHRAREAIRRRQWFNTRSVKREEDKEKEVRAQRKGIQGKPRPRHRARRKGV
jgi:hypothetical protein